MDFLIPLERTITIGLQRCHHQPVLASGNLMEPLTKALDLYKELRWSRYEAWQGNGHICFSLESGQNFPMITIAFRCNCIILHLLSCCILIPFDSKYQCNNCIFTGHRAVQPVRKTALPAPRRSTLQLGQESCIDFHCVIEAEPEILLQTGSCDRCCGPKDSGRGTTHRISVESTKNEEIPNYVQHLPTWHFLIFSHFWHFCSVTGCQHIMERDRQLQG